MSSTNLLATQHPPDLWLCRMRTTKLLLLSCATRVHSGTHPMWVPNQRMQSARGDDIALFSTYASRAGATMFMHVDGLRRNHRPGEVRKNNTNVILHESV